jgi:hypothetical protein
MPDATSGGSDDRELRDELARDELRLAELKRQIAASEREAAVAAAKARDEACRAEVEGIQAQAKGRASDCLAQKARIAACEAENSEKAAVGTGVGCALGMLFPPVGLVACAGGGLLGLAVGSTCGSLTCELDEGVILRTVLAESKLQALPACDEQRPLGLAETRADEEPIGMRVVSVDGGSPAALLGILAGDRILRIDDAPATSASALRDSIAAGALRGRIAVYLLRTSSVVLVLRGAAASSHFGMTVIPVSGAQI